MRRYNLLQPIKQKGGTARSFQRVLGAALAVLMMVGLMVPSALAASYESAPPTSSPTPTGDCSLSLTFAPVEKNEDGKDEAQPVANHEFTLYRVAEVFMDENPKNAQYQVLEPFQKYNVLEGYNGDKDWWIKAASTLAPKIKADPPQGANTWTASTNSEGVVSFTNLPKGIYMLMSEKVGDLSKGEFEYTPTPNLITLPAYKSIDEGWVINGVEGTLKYERKTVQLSVHIEWKDNDNKGNTRPDSVTVQLYHTVDGKEKVIHEVVVPAGENWSHTWTDPWGDLNARILDTSRKDLIDRTYKESTMDDYTRREDGTTRIYTFTLTLDGIDVPDPEVPGSGDPQTTSVRVLKVWEDDNDAAGMRPSSVTVDLLGDGKVEKTVELSAANNWRYTWNNLNKNTTWEIAEQSVDGYTVITTTSGVTRTITNTYNPRIIDDEDPPLIDLPEDPDVPLDPGTPGTTDPVEPPIDAGDPDIPLDPGFPDNPVYPGDPDIPLVPASPDPGTDVPDEDVPLEMLPQTGLLWWPVPILAILGAALIVMGYARRRRA